MSARTPEQLHEQNILTDRIGEVREGISLLRPVVERGRPQQVDEYAEAARGALGTDNTNTSVSETPTIDGSKAGVDYLAKSVSDYRISA